MIRRIATTALTAALTIAVCADASASSGGRLDPDFGENGGWTVTSVADRTLVAYGSTVLSNGKVALAGQLSDDSGNSQVVVARYRRDGTPDPTFGEDGLFVSSFPEADAPFVATAVAQDPSSRKIVVGGGYGQGSMMALRLTAGGRLDSSFGAGGTGRTVIPSGGIAQTMAVQDNGRILLGGSNANDNGRPMVVARLRPGGNLDPSFGQGGQIQSLFWNPTVAASAGVAGIVPTPDGGLVGFGHLDYIGSDGHGSAGVFRLDPGGDPVGSFGQSGHAEIDFELPNGDLAFWFPCAMTVDGSGAITVTGDGTGSGGGALLTTRLTAAGEPDPSFGRSGDGKVQTQGIGGDGFTTCGASRAANGSLITGVGSTLIQLTARGARRQAFAPGGVLSVTEPANVGINSVGRVDRRRFVVAGSAGDDLYIARYLAPPTR